MILFHLFDVKRGQFYAKSICKINEVEQYIFLMCHKGKNKSNDDILGHFYTL